MNISTNISPPTLLCKEEDSHRDANNLTDVDEHDYCSRQQFVTDDASEKHAESSTRLKRTFLVIRSARATTGSGIASHALLDADSIFEAQRRQVFRQTSAILDEKKPRRPDHRKKTAKVCGHCGKLVLNLSRHVRAMHTVGDDDVDNAIVCALCDKTFQRVELLRSHNQRMKHECPICHLLVVNLNGHNRKTHINIRPFACKLCGRSYVWQSYLSAHEKRCHRRNDTDNTTEVIIEPMSDVEEKPNSWMPIDD